MFLSRFHAKNTHATSQNLWLWFFPFLNSNISPKVTAPLSWLLREKRNAGLKEHKQISWTPKKTKKKKSHFSTKWHFGKRWKKSLFPVNSMQYFFIFESLQCCIVKEIFWMYQHKFIFSTRFFNSFEMNWWVMYILKVKTFWKCNSKFIYNEIL